MTKHPVTKLCRLAIAVAIPLVLTVCYTPPAAVDSISQLVDVGLAAPSTTALIANEPSAPVVPVIEAVAVKAVRQPEKPKGADTDGDLMRMSRDDLSRANPAVPDHPTVLSVVAIRSVTEPEKPLGVRADDEPVRGVQAEPSRPPNPELLTALPLGALVQPVSPLGNDGADAVRERAGLVPPAIPLNPVMGAALNMSLAYPQGPSAVGPSIIQSPTDADFNRVRVLIARAEEVDAHFYDPQNLNDARGVLDTAQRIRSVDPGGAHVALRVAEARANEAFQNSVRLAAERLRNLLQDHLEELREIQADRWVPVSFQETVDAVHRAEELYRASDYFGAYRLALATVTDMLALRDLLLDRLELLYGARTETERCLAAAQGLDTSDWSTSRLGELRSLYDQLNALYLTGLEAIQSYQLGDAEEAFSASTEVCRTLMGVADDAYVEQMEQAAALLKAVMEEIEEASKLTLVDKFGDVLRPEPWLGQAILDALRSGEMRRAGLLDGADPGAAPADLESIKGLKWTLKTARSYWIEGVVAFDDQKYGQSIQLFRDGRRYLERYKFYAVIGIHVVQLIPERRESLWRISEYPRWYDDPFLWPRIWRRNRDLIQNPDLIYPNWELIIPAL